jgi:hypothetical protein
MGQYPRASMLDRGRSGILGGFNRSSQHFNKGGCDEGIQVAFGSVCASSFAIARPGADQNIFGGDGGKRNSRTGESTL